MGVRKVPFFAGAEWLLASFTLLRRSPFGLGLLGLIYGLLSVAGTLLAQAMPDLMAATQGALMLVGPLLIAGMIYAAREVDQGRSAAPMHLLRGLQEGKAGRLIGTLLPQLAALVVCAALLYVMVGPEQIKKIMSLMQTLQANPQATPDPAMVAGFPLGRVLLWLLIVIGVGIVAGFFTFTAVPDMMFADVGLFDSMRRSFHACSSNLGALIVFFLLMFLALLALSVGINVVALIAALIAGDQAMTVVATLLMSAIFMPVFSAVMYFAWKQMLGDEPAAPAAPVAGIEV